MFKVLSWGRGVQSTTLAAMSALGYLPRLDAILSADLHWESQATQEATAWYFEWLTRQGMHVEILDAGDIRKLGALEHIHMPFWTSNGGPLGRQCTSEFKIKTIRRRSRELAGYHRSKAPHPKPGTIQTWLGISLDEWTRMGDSGVKYAVNHYPLIDLRMTREDCEGWLKDHNLLIPPKSACVGCPYRTAREYLTLAESEIKEAIEFDEKNRNNPLAATGSTADRIFIWHESRPLAEVDLGKEAEAERARQRAGKQLPLMCESGHCWC